MCGTVRTEGVQPSVRQGAPLASRWLRLNGMATRPVAVPPPVAHLIVCVTAWGCEPSLILNGP